MGRREGGRRKSLKNRFSLLAGKAQAEAMKKEPGIDGILVTIGLCIIALLLCVVMKNSLQTFITTIVNEMSAQAQKILTGVGP